MKNKIPNRVLSCYLCGMLTSKEFEMERQPTRDHVIPKSQGGRSVRYACFDCNQKKANKSLCNFVNDNQNISVDNFLKRNENDLEVISLYYKQERNR